MRQLYLILAFLLTAGAQHGVFGEFSSGSLSEQAQAIIREAGNAEDDAIRLVHLSKLADQLANDGTELEELDALTAFISRWINPAERLEFFSGEVIRTQDYDIGVKDDSPLASLAAIYKARMLVWVNFEYSSIYPYPEKRALYLGKARKLFEQAHDDFPDNRVISMYLGDPLKPEKTYSVPLEAPQWAVAQREGLERLTDVIDWWIDHRLQPNGEYGGGWGDDCEMWRHWAPVLIGFDYPKANWAQAYHSERLLAQPHLAGGYHNRLMDVEHTAEDISDALAPMMHIAPDNPEWAQRALRLVDLADNLWMGRNERGFLQFKSTYFTANDVDQTSARACDTVYHPRALQPALLYWQRSNDERVGRLVVDWMKTWVDAAARNERGKPAGIIPTAVHWPDGGIGGIGEKWWLPENYDTPLYDFPSAMSLMVNTLLQTYHQTGDESYLEPIRTMASARLEWTQSGIKDPLPGSRMWCAARLDQLIGVLAKYSLLTGDSQFDALLSQEKEVPYAQFLLNDDLGALTSSLEALAHVLSVNFPSYTSEVRYTDRVFRFPILYQPEWMLKEGADDRLLLIEAGVLAMGLNRVHLLYNTVTGDPGDPLYFPMNAVRWHTAPRNLAALVTQSTPQRFEAQLYHFGEYRREFDCELFLLNPGTYVYSLSDTDKGQTFKNGEIVISQTDRLLPITIPSQVEVTLTLTPAKP
jgi:hypothetical protein